jgi:hypothetical protein
MTEDEQQIAEALAANHKELIGLKRALHAFATDLGRALKPAARTNSASSIKSAFENAEAAAKRLAAKLG